MKDTAISLLASDVDWFKVACRMAQIAPSGFSIAVMLEAGNAPYDWKEQVKMAKTPGEASDLIQKLAGCNHPTLGAYAHSLRGGH
ncbi:hypothetical protein RSO41_06095 [Halomonas sp. I1]|uniref:hypothetical protein n=1 Tax=Halomonas sp. I1 TaxID=393536 RepID=UPI0028DDFEFB|nr:hypothetical protein [Halomonas sp. I1]MDT8894221.1 hypothetical protein [Halomonas sp. I1]